MSARVVIVGAGASGLFLGLCLAKAGIDFVILEKETSRNPHSRSIGIHPPLLVLLNALGVGDRFFEKGRKIRYGLAIVGSKRTFKVDFSEADAAFPFILTLQQPETEAILESALEEMAPGRLLKGVSDLKIRLQKEESVVCDWRYNEGFYSENTSLLVGCDGKNSSVREQARIRFEGGPYPDTYMMCDVPDTTGAPDTGILYFHRDGIVESFPLPGDMRRWVVKTDRYQERPSGRYILDEVQRRTGKSHDANAVTMTSSFGVQHFLAETFVRGRIVLVGDAAHIISPIGGQGMNLGWLDAWHLASVLAKYPEMKGAAFENALSRYNTERRRKTQLGMQSAWFNMAFGRKFPFDSLRVAAIRFCLLPFIRPILLKRFTMYGLTTQH
jgi:2-polyprenyl-6-methoxyphenol hydroxylase-like FAD-dependent oxidoreductase